MHDSLSVNYARLASSTGKTSDLDHQVFRAAERTLSSGSEYQAQQAQQAID